MKPYGKKVKSRAKYKDTEESKINFMKYMQRQEGGDLTQPYDKSPYTNRNVNRAVTTQTTPQKSSIKQRLWTDTWPNE